MNVRISTDLLVCIDKEDKTLYSKYDVPGITNVVFKSDCINLWWETAVTNSRGMQSSDINGHLQHLSDVCRSQQAKNLAVEMFVQQILIDTIITLGCNKEVPEHATAKSNRLKKAKQCAEIHRALHIKALQACSLAIYQNYYTGLMFISCLLHLAEGKVTKNGNF